MHLFDGFDKKDLVIGTSGFYAAALALMVSAILMQDYLLLRKSSESQSRTNIEVKAAVVSLHFPKIVSYNTSSGFGSTIKLDTDIGLSMVAEKVDVIMQSSEFTDMHIVLNCSKLDCSVEFTVDEYEKLGIAKIANEWFVSLW